MSSKKVGVKGKVIYRQGREIVHNVMDVHDGRGQKRNSCSLGKLQEDEIFQHCNEILEKWQICKPKEIGVHQMSNEEVEEKLAKLMESKSLAITKQKQYTEEEKKIREAILSQYSQMSDDEGDNGEGDGGGGKGNGENGLAKNLNAHAVAQAEKIKREQAKIDSQKKKEKDKEDREKQKQLKEEKKEKRKTVKGERKR